ncbi:hypothetical protein [Maritalea sp.]|uniref:hypothetical protein n=1 Tax=Maritalea sp. TaxID=2003361 RepID=UPI003EF8E56B
MRVLLISNGYGEDAMAAVLAKELVKTVKVEALPTVGPGKSYAGICDVVGPRGKLASEGHRKIGSLLKDFQSGLAVTAVKHVKFMRDQRGRWDKIVTVGDMIGPLLAFAGGQKVDLHIDVYNSGFARHYSTIEKQILKRTVKKVLCRDDILAGALRAIDVDAGFAGNLMMDTVPTLDFDVSSLVQDKTAVTLLPGSREGAGKLFQMQMDAISRLSSKYPLTLFVPVAPSVELDRLLKRANLKRVDGELLGNAHLAIAATADGTKVHFFDKGIGTLAKGSLFVVGQQGTAIFQSAGLGTPVIAIVADDSRKSRVQRNERLLGDSRISTEQDVGMLARKMEMFLSDPKTTKQRGKVGIERVGPPGALDAAVRIIVNG